MLSRLGALKLYVIMKKNIIDERISSISRMRKEVIKLEKLHVQAQTSEEKKEVLMAMIEKNEAIHLTTTRLLASIAVALEIDNILLEAKH